MNRLLRLLILVLLALSPCYCLAAIRTYNFTGTVFGAGGSPYGTNIPGGTPVSGQLEYDTSFFSRTSGNVSIYPQSFANGFMANFGSVPVIASDYSVHIVNDQTQPDHSVKDIFTVEWWTNDNPAPATPLNFNGMSESAGIFSMSLFYPSSTFSDTSLPASIPTSGFNGFITSFLSHSASGTIDVLYSVNTVSAMPQPLPLRGDINQDGHVNAADISPLNTALVDLDAYRGNLTGEQLAQFADLDGDGQETNADLQGLIDCLANGGGGGTLTAVPEPATWSLSVSGALTLSLARYTVRRRQ